MAQVAPVAMAFASPIEHGPVPEIRAASDGKVGVPGEEQVANVFLTPPDSMSPDLPAHGEPVHAQSPSPINIEYEMELQDPDELDVEQEIEPPVPTGTPLSKGALSGLDASNTITPAMLAKYHLPGIMLGVGPRPIRYVMYELTQSVPGFSRIPPAKARRLVVAALESRHGGGLDGNVTFSKTGWGRWDAHIKGSSRDSAIGSFQEGHLSPPRSDRSSYAMSNGDSAVNMPGPRIPSGYRDPQSRGSWTASSLREADELELDMDVLENEADKMSLDGERMVDADDSSSMNDDTDEEDWAVVGSDALRKASLPTPGAPRLNYNAMSIPGYRPARSWARRPSGYSQRSLHSTSLPYRSDWGHGATPAIDPSTATPEEKAAVAALLSLGSM